MHRPQQPKRGGRIISEEQDEAAATGALAAQMIGEAGKQYQIINKRIVGVRDTVHHGIYSQLALSFDDGSQLVINGNFTVDMPRDPFTDAALIENAKQTEADLAQPDPLIQHGRDLMGASDAVREAAETIEVEAEELPDAEDEH